MNREVVEMICRECGADFDSNVVFVQDRPFNDRRYAISCDKIATLGWLPKRTLANEIPGVVSWYRKNVNHLARRLKWFEELASR